MSEANVALALTVQGRQFLIGITAMNNAFARGRGETPRGTPRAVLNFISMVEQEHARGSRKAARPVQDQKPADA